MLKQLHTLPLAASCTWNSFPDHLKNATLLTSCQPLLKTHLFLEALASVPSSSTLLQLRAQSSLVLEGEGRRAYAIPVASWSCLEPPWGKGTFMPSPQGRHRLPQWAPLFSRRRTRTLHGPHWGHAVWDWATIVTDTNLVYFRGKNCYEEKKRIQNSFFSSFLFNYSNASSWHVLIFNPQQGAHSSLNFSLTICSVNHHWSTWGVYFLTSRDKRDKWQDINQPVRWKLQHGQTNACVYFSQVTKDMANKKKFLTTGPCLVIFKKLNHERVTKNISEKRHWKVWQLPPPPPHLPFWRSNKEALLIAKAEVCALWLLFTDSGFVSRPQMLWLITLNQSVIFLQRTKLRLLHPTKRRHSAFSLNHNLCPLSQDSIST